MIFLHFPEKIYKAVLDDPAIQNKQLGFMLRNTAFNFAVMMVICLVIAVLWTGLDLWRLVGLTGLCLAGSVFDSARQYQVLSDRNGKR